MKNTLLICSFCQQEFLRSSSDMASNNSRAKKAGNLIKSYCSLNCKNMGRRIRKTCTCLNCSENYERVLSQIGKQTFCSSSCAAIYNNAHKTRGTRRSKLEVYLEKILKEKYPNLSMHFNQKDTIHSELDIYIPSLKLAFELNGVFHYEPIYGEEKLSSIQNNDRRKFQACLEKNIELCIIDSSKLVYFKEEKAKEFLDIIVSIIDSKLNKSLTRIRT